MIRFTISIDDRIDVVSRGTMGLTVNCARCHDHKFDPVSTQDYYALYGVFLNSQARQDLPVIGDGSGNEPGPAVRKGDYGDKRKAL